MIVKSEADLEGLKKIGRLVASIRDELKEKARPGITTKELDEWAGKRFAENGAVSGPKGEYDFPGYTCISVNEEVAHGIPGDRVLKEGDLVNVDVSGSLDGYYADTGISFVVGKGDPELFALCECAQRAFDSGLKKIRAGNRQNQIGRAVEKAVYGNGFEVLLNLTGHGVGKALHEDPEYILNYYDPYDTGLLQDGMVIAFEPFVSTGTDEVVESGDGWTYVTPDGSFVAQVEHTVIVTKGTPIVLTR